MSGMNSIGGYGGMGGIRGFGGLASGLDRDALIENMTYGTTSKIERQRQKKMALQWQQTAIRNITDKMISFADKYTGTLTSATNLFSSAFWGRTDITAVGANSKYVTASGRADSANPISIAGIKQLAAKARLSSAKAVSDQTLKTGSIDVNAMFDVDTLKGETIEIRYGKDTYTVSLSGSDEKGNAYRFDTAENIKKSLNEIFKKTELKDGKKLSDVISADVSGGSITLTNDAGLSNVALAGGSALEKLGFKQAGEDFKEMEIAMDNTPLVAGTAVDESKLVEKKSFADYVAGKELKFNYNGKTTTVKIPTADKLKDGGDILGNLKTSIQDQLDAAYGKGRIGVDFVKDSFGNPTTQLAFSTLNPADGKADESSTLTLVSGSDGLLGVDGALKVAKGTSNRLDMKAALGKDLEFTLNGEKFSFTADKTMNDVLKAINASEKANLSVSYESVSDKFIFTSKAEGASGQITFEGTDATNLANIKDIFGITKADNEITGEDGVRGTDAIVSVQYGNSGETVELIRDTNNFTIDGMTIGLKGTFGYNGDKVDPNAEAITFDAKVNTDKVMDSVKKMVEELNEIIALVSKETTTRPDRDYAPLTDAQKKELSEDEIKTYEEKAKEGLLFNDNDLKSLSNELRFIISGADMEALKEIGITTSTSYSDNGKLVIDETKLRAALETNPEKVEELFTKKNTVDENGVSVGDGIATKLQGIMDKYAKTMGAPGHKGILVERAGTTKSPLSITTNALYKQMESIDKVIKDLQARLQAEEDRYIKQFTSLESLISQMNAQSSALSQFGGGY